MAGFGNFEEDKHPRGEGGKFTSTAGGGGGSDHQDSTSALSDRAFIEQHRERLEEAALYAGQRYDSATGKFVTLQEGSDEHHAARSKALHEEASKIVTEGQARKAGLVPALPEAIARARAANDEANKSVDAINAELSPAHKGALKAAGELDALRNEDYGIGDDLISRGDLAYSLSEGSDALGGERYDEDDGSDEDSKSPYARIDEIDVERDDDGNPIEWDDTDRPERIQFDDGAEGDEEYEEELAAHEERKQEHEKNAAEYSRIKAELQAKYDAKASEAQDRLEGLHKKQVEALGKLKDESKKLSKFQDNEEYNLDDDEAVFERFQEKFPEAQYDDDEGAWYGANAEYDEEDAVWRDPDDGEVKPDAKLNALYNGAKDAYRRDVETAQTAVEDEGFRGGSVAQETLKESIKETAAAIRELAKYNKRPAKLAKPPKRTRKSANRPGRVTRESVEGMAPAARFKLTLSKLDFLSLVDHPAQQTASIRLIKRAGTQESVEAQMLARIVKVGEGDDPLLYCWAFTCTDESGRPYHDLQGDAVSPDFIKAAEEFVKAGGAVDEMHDGAQKSRIAFAYPMDSEIASAMLGKAAGSATKISGLMVAIRPTAEQLAKVRAKEFNGVSIAGAGIRELMKGRKTKRQWVPYRRRVSKMTVLTSLNDGHQHAICLDDPEHAWATTLATSYATSEGADQGHSHPWTYDATTGAITIGEDSGHTHTTDEVVPAEVMAEAADDDDGKQCPSCRAECDEDDRYCCYCGASLYGAPAPSAPAAPAAPSVVVVSARANSPRSGATPTVKSEEQVMATEQENKIAELQKQNARLEKLSSMNDAQRIHFGKLSGSEADSFLAKSSHERDLVLSDIEKANEVVYTSPIDGAVYRKNDDRRLIEIAKRHDATTEQLRAAEVAKREVEFAKKGDEVLTHVAKGLKGDLRARLMKAVNAEFAVPAEYEEAVTALKGLNFAAAQLAKSTGVNPHVDPNQTQTPAAQLTALTKRIMLEKNLSEAAATVAALETAEGAALYAQIPVGRA